MKSGKWVGLTLTTLLSGSVFGAGFQLYTEGSAEALGQAGAISGRTNMTSQAWYNPAALAGADRPAIMVGSAFASIKTDYVEAGTGNDVSMSDEWRAIPHFYYVQPISKDWTGVISINAPYGLITEWDDDWAGASLATYSELQAIYITPSVAWQAFDLFAVSAGLNIVDAEADLQRTGVRVQGDDLSYGATMSAHLQPWEDWGFGFRYQSSVKLDITGSLNGALPASADLELPSTMNVGVANSSINNLSLGLDLVWTEWSTYKNLTINTPGGPVTAPKNWEDVISVRIGGEYALGEDWKIRAGYVWDESPVPDATRGPELPGTNRQMVMFGFGWSFWSTMTLDAAYSYLWAENGMIAANTEGLAGEFETATHLLAVSLGYTF